MKTHLLLINGITVCQGTEKQINKIYESSKGKHDFVTLVEVLKTHQCQTVQSQV